MKKFLILLSFALLMAACLPIPAATPNTGYQVAYCVDQTADLPVFPFISNNVAVLGDKCVPVYMDSKIVVPVVPNISLLINDPPKLYLCGVNADTSNISLKGIWDWLQANWWWIASVLLTISEGLGLTKKIESNSILQLFISWVKKKAVKPTT